LWIISFLSIYLTILIFMLIETASTQINCIMMTQRTSFLRSIEILTWTSIHTLRAIILKTFWSVNHIDVIGAIQWKFVIILKKIAKQSLLNYSLEQFIYLLFLLNMLCFLNLPLCYLLMLVIVIHGYALTITYIDLTFSIFLLH
jgi:hypothetical protein